MNEYDRKVERLRAAIALLDGADIAARAIGPLANCRGTLVAVTNPPRGGSKPTSAELGRAAFVAAECYLWTFGHWPK